MTPRTHRLLLVLSFGIGAVALAYGLGYRLPGFARHPDWQDFPHVTSSHLVVEEIPQFDSIYGQRFSFDYKKVEEMTLSDRYRTNLHNIHSLRYQITTNYFRSGFRMPLSSWTGAAEMGRSQEQPEATGFIPEGCQYLSVQLGTEVGYFKGHFTGSFDNRQLVYQHKAFDNGVWFYQYNQPSTTRDTLYLRYHDSNWRIFYR